MLRSTTIRCTLAAVACAISFSAHAVADQQLAQADEGASPSPASVGGQAASSQESSKPVTLEEVVVTAQKRAERLQDVPISIAVLGGTDLDKSSVQGVTEALSTVPGVSVMQAYQGGGTLITVRGVAAGGPLFGGASPIAYYIDSVPFGLIKTAIAPDAQAFDLQQVEVLRGPQGTLYGSSALNGVVRILTNDADLNNFDFKARVSDSGTVGGGDNYQGDMAVNVPIIDGVLAARAVLGYDKESGWIDTPNARDVNDAEIKNARLKINAQPVDNLSIGLSAWISRADYGAPSIGNSHDFDTATLPQPVTTDFDAYGLKVGYNFQDFTVTSATSYFKYSNTGYLDLSVLGYFISPGVPIDLFTTQDARVTTEEINFASTNSGVWRWTAGGMFRHDSEQLSQANLPLPGANITDELSTSYAGYGELTRLFFHDQLELTAGVRRFLDQQSNQDFDFSSVGIPDGGKFNATTPRLVLTLHPNNESTIYTSFSEGFRSGLVSGPPLPSSLEYTKPDTLRNYEVGAKGTLMNGVVSYDSAVYFIDWRGVQQLITVPVDVGGVTIPETAIVNAQSASGPGVDLSLAVRPVANLTLSATFSWNDLTFDRNVISGGQILFGKGNRLNFSPEYTGGASAAYGFPLGSNGWRGEVSVSGNYTSAELYRSLLGSAVVSGTGDSMLIARTDFSIISTQKWRVTAFVENLTNDRGTPIVTPYLLTGSNDWNDRIRPRTAGLRFAYGL
jgi:iron complex outermembrane recepter protein